MLGAAHASAEAGERWIATWGSAQLEPYATETLPPHALDHATLRQVVHVSAGGAKLRLRLSNAFGQTPLEILSVHIARTRPAGAIDPASVHQVTFSGAHSVSLPMGAEFVSDPLDVNLPPLSDLTIDLELATTPDRLTFHAGARATSFFVAGQHAGEPVLQKPQTVTRWYFLTGVEIVAGKHGASAVMFGDSITDGHGATTDGNDRWPDVLARRLAAGPHTREIGVVNAGIGGNHLLYDGLGPNALARFDHDVLARPGVRSLLVLEGINDIGGLDRVDPHDAATHTAWLAQIEQALAQIALRAHASGLQAYAATLTPFVGSEYYHPGAASEADRRALNDWIRTSGTFDGVVDFDAAVRDPAQPDRLLPACDSGDHLHPGPEGYRRMAEAVPLNWFEH